MLGMDSTQYRAGVRTAKGETNKFQKHLATVGRSIAGAFAVGAIINLGRQYLEWASDLSVAARNVGILTSEMMALREIAVQANLGTGDMQRLLAKLQSELFRAAAGAATSQKKFTDLGLSMRELAGMDPAKQLQAVARAALDSAIPLQTLTELFGERLGPNAMVALRQIAEEGLPAVSSRLGEVADSVEALGSKWARMSERIKQSGLAALDTFAKGIGLITDFVTGGPNGVREGTERRGRTEAERRGKRAQEAADTRRQMQDMVDAKSRLEMEAEMGSSVGSAGFDRAQNAEREAARTAEAKRSLSIEASARAAVEADRLGVEASAQAALEARKQRRRELWDRAHAAVAAVYERPTGVGRGQGVRSDRMAAVGGMVGAQRAGVAAADRALRLAVESSRRDEERNRILKDTLDAVEAPM